MTLPKIGRLLVKFTVEQSVRKEGTIAPTLTQYFRSCQEVDDKFLRVTDVDRAKGIVYASGCGNPDCKVCCPHNALTLDDVKKNLLGLGYINSEMADRKVPELVETMLFHRPDFKSTIADAKASWAVMDVMRYVDAALVNGEMGESIEDHWSVFHGVMERLPGRFPSFGAEVSEKIVKVVTDHFKTLLGDGSVVDSDLISAIAQLLMVRMKRIMQEHFEKS